MKLAIFLPNWVGDACMAMPTLRALRQGLSRGTKFVGISRPGPAALLRDQGWIDEWLIYKSHAKDGNLNRRGMIRELRRYGCDAALLLTNSFSSAIAASLARIPRRVGYARDGRSWLLTDRLPVPRNGGRPRPTPAIDYYLALADHMGCPSVERSIQFSIDKKYLAMADQLWHDLGFDLGRDTVVINNNAANATNRLWPTEYVERFANKLVRNREVQVLLHCGPSEREQANQIAQRIDHPMVQSMGNFDDLPLGLSQAVFARSRVIITTDSGARHLAVASDRPVLTLFGPTTPAWTMTYNVPETILQAEILCDACSKSSRHNNRAPKQCNCMKNIEVERTFIATINRLQDATMVNAKRAA